MKLAASLTATGLLGLLLLEALKILLAPVAAWLLGMVMIAAKFALIGLVVSLLLALGVFLYKRSNRSSVEAG